jgi:argininosuccinate synthase
LTPRCAVWYGIRVKTIFAFNGDLESRLALHWLVHERGREVIALSVNLGQGIYLEPLGELALELGAGAARVVDRREEFLREFALPILQANAVYESGCFLGSALARFLIARELVLVAREEGCRSVAHASATKGNDQVRLEAALAAQDPALEVLAPVRQWNLRTLDDKLNYARRRGLPVEAPRAHPVTIDRNLWGTSIFLDDLHDTWEPPPPDAFTLTRAAEQAPDQPALVTLGFEEGVPCSLDGGRLALLPLVRQLTALGGEHGVGRSDVIEDRLFGHKSREFYETPAATLLRLAHQDLESLVQTRELLQMKETLSRRYAELVYAGLWFHDLRRALQGFFAPTQRFVTGEVRLKLFKGAAQVVGRRSPHSLYDPATVSRTNQDLFDCQRAQAFTSLWSLPVRLAARRQPADHAGGWALP